MNHPHPAQPDPAVGESQASLVFRTDTGDGSRYQVDGQGFVAPDLAGATRYHVDREAKTIGWLPPVQTGCFIEALAPVRVLEAHEDAVRCRWGGHSFEATPVSLWSDVCLQVREQLGCLIHFGGPFGAGISIRQRGKSRIRRECLFNIELLPPAGQDEVLLPPVRLAQVPPREIIARLGLLGLRARRLPADTPGGGTTRWSRSVGSFELRFDTGPGCREAIGLTLVGPDSALLRGPDTPLPFPELHRKLTGFLLAARKAKDDPPALRAAFHFVFTS